MSMLSAMGICTSPAVRPVLSVVMVSAVIGRTARAKPAESLVTRNCLRLSSSGETRLMTWSCIGKLSLDRELLFRFKGLAPDLVVDQHYQRVLALRQVVWAVEAQLAGC